MSEEKKEKIFVEGMYYSKPIAGTPDFVEGKLGLKAADFLLWMFKNTEGININTPEVIKCAKYIREAVPDAYVNIDLLRSQKGTRYAALNTWKPKKQDDKVEEAVKNFDKPEEIDPENIPF